MSRKHNRRVKSPYGKYCDAIDVIHNIVAKHPIGIIQQQHNTYRTQREARIDKPALKASYYLYNRYLQNKETVDNYEMNLPQGHIPLLRVHKCDNCYRMQEIEGHQNCEWYSIQFFQRSSYTIGYKQKYKTVKYYSSDNNTRMYNVCKEFNTYLDEY